MVNQSTTRFNRKNAGTKWHKKSVFLLVFGVLLLVLNACTDTEPSGVIKSDGNGGIALDFTAPDMLRNSRAIEPTALSLDVTVNGREVELDGSSDQQRGVMTVARGSVLRVVATWSEFYNGSLLDLAQASQDYTVPVNPDTEILVRFVAGDYFTGFDADRDGVSNLAERNADTNPSVANVSSDPIVFVPVTFNAQLPQLLNDASSDVNDSLFAVAEINRTSILLSREGDRWSGETTFPTDTDVLVNFVVYSSADRDVPLAKWQNTRNVGSGAAVTITGTEYTYNEFNSDGDDLNNAQEVLGGTNPLDKSDPAPDQDGDGVSDGFDNCRVDENTDQADTDGDGIGDVCDTVEPVPAPDQDGDGVADEVDNCRVDENTDQADSDGDGIGDACDTVEPVPAPDQDGDGVADEVDNCLEDENTDQADADGDGVGDACEIVVSEPPTNPDGEPLAASNLIYEYYEGRWSELPDFDSLTPINTGTSGTFELPPSNDVLFYGLRFSGRLSVAEAGQYTFYTASNDGTKLFIDGSLIIDNDGTHVLTEVDGTVSLATGLRDITLEYFQSNGTEALEVSWSSASIAKQPIPSDVLFSP